MLLPAASVNFLARFVQVSSKIERSHEEDFFSLFMRTLTGTVAKGLQCILLDSWMEMVDGALLWKIVGIVLICLDN